MIVYFFAILTKFDSSRSGSCSELTRVDIRVKCVEKVQQTGIQVAKETIGSFPHALEKPYIRNGEKTPQPEYSHLAGFGLSTEFD